MNYRNISVTFVLIYFKFFSVLKVTLSLSKSEFFSLNFVFIACIDIVRIYVF